MEEGTKQDRAQLEKAEGKGAERPEISHTLTGVKGGSEAWGMAGRAQMSEPRKPKFKSCSASGWVTATALALLPRVHTGLPQD